MASNIKVAHNVSSDGAIITGFRYVDAPTVTLGSEGGSDNPTPTTTTRSFFNSHILLFLIPDR